MIDQIRSTQEYSLVITDRSQVARHEPAKIHTQTTRALLTSGTVAGQKTARASVRCETDRHGWIKSRGGSSAGEDTGMGTAVGHARLVVPIGGWLVTCIVQLASGSGGGWRQVAFEAGLGWLIGAFLFIAGSGHLFVPAETARPIGWAPSPFQWEVGVASLGMGIAGALAPAQPRPFQLATLIVFSTFMLGAAVGHVAK